MPLRRLPATWPLVLTTVLLAMCAFTLASCGVGDGRSGGGEELSSEPLRVGVSPVPHGEILQFVKDELAPKAGLVLDIREYTDYVLPNTDLEQGDLDANYFQIPAYLEETAKKDDAPLVSVVGVHVEPLGLYSNRIDDVKDIRPGATLVIPSEEVTITRSLKLLAANDLIAVRDERAATVGLDDITANPRNLVITTTDAARTPRALDDHDLAVINGNYALEAGLTPSTDALLSEQVAGNPNVNLLATVERKRTDPRIEKLAELLTSPEVKAFIEKKYKGAVVPAF